MLSFRCSASFQRDFFKPQRCHRAGFGSKIFTYQVLQYTEVRFASFFFRGFIIAVVVNSPEKDWKNAPLCSRCKGEKRAVLALCNY